MNNFVIWEVRIMKETEEESLLHCWMIGRWWHWVTWISYRRGCTVRYCPLSDENTQISLSKTKVMSISKPSICFLSSISVASFPLECVLRIFLSFFLACLDVSVNSSTRFWSHLLLISSQIYVIWTQPICFLSLLDLSSKYFHAIF